MEMANVIHSHNKICMGLMTLTILLVSGCGSDDNKKCVVRVGMPIGEAQKVLEQQEAKDISADIGVIHGETSMEPSDKTFYDVMYYELRTWEAMVLHSSGESRDSLKVDKIVVSKIGYADKAEWARQEKTEVTEYEIK